jgi:hypothetical protein
MTRTTVSVVDRRLHPVRSHAQTIANGLIRCGVDARAYTDADPEAMKAAVILLVGQPSSNRQTIRRLEQAGSNRPRVAAWLFEPLPPPDMPLDVVRAATRYSAIGSGRSWMRPVIHALTRPNDALLARRWGRDVDTGTFRFLIDSASFIIRGGAMGWLDAVFVSTEQKRRQLGEWGVRAEFLPVGQQPGFGRDLHRPRDIDLLFIGSLKSARRQRVLTTLFQELGTMGLTAHVPAAPIRGEDRTNLVNRAKVMLHMHQFEWDTPWMRWCLASANGAVVVSEPLSIPAPLRPGIDYLEAPVAELGEAIAALARDEPRRQAMRDACRAQMDQTMTQAASLETLSVRLHTLVSGARR